MILANFKIAYRNMIRHKTHSLINIAGPAIGIALCTLIVLYVQDELSFDRQHQYADRIYRINRVFLNSDGSFSDQYASLAPSFLPLLEEEIPEIEHGIRMFYTQQSTITVGEQLFEEKGFFLAEHDIFEIFTIPFLKGDPATALTEPKSVVITASTAAKYFGQENPLGQQILLDGRFPFQITGIIADATRNSHFHYELIGSYLTLKGLFGEGENDYFHGSRNFSDNVTFTYVRIAEDARIDDIVSRIPDFLDRHLGQSENRQGQTLQAHERTGLRFMKVSDIHLHSNVMGEIEANSDIRLIYIFSVTALFILLIACTNFINLATAQAMRRSKEVGLRKVSGATRHSLIFQFFCESLATTFVAALIAIVFVALALPAFNNFTAKAMSLATLLSPARILILLVIFITTALFSGLYPAYYVSSFQPARILRGEILRGKRANTIRKVLVVLQFSVTIALIAAVGILTKQMNYIYNKDLGFEQENIVLLGMDPVINEHWDDVKQALIQNPGVVSVAASKRSPSERLGDAPGYRIYLNDQWKDNPVQMPHNRVGLDFFRTYGMQIIAGRDFSPEHPTDESNAFIINETAAEQLGLDSPADAIGIPLSLGNREGHIIGVVADFHYESLHRNIIPILTYIRMPEANTIAVRIQPNDIPAALSQIKATLQSFQPGYPAEHLFLDQKLNRQYKNEMQMKQLLQYFSLFAVLVACLGLFGLASYMIERRTKEIGIRKVLGASVPGIILTVTKPYISWVILASCIALPAAYFMINKWLQNFVYRVDPDPWSFLLAVAAALLVSLLTVGYHAIRSASANPVDSLRYE